MSSCAIAKNSQAVQEAMQLLGDDWVLRIISALENGPQRFCQIERAISASNPVTLTDRLKRLERVGIIDRHSADVGAAVHYTLTQKGRGTLPLLEAIEQFAQSYL